MDLPNQVKAARAKLQSVQAQPGQSFYGLTGATVVLDRNCSVTVYVLDKDGVPAAGLPIINQWPDGSENIPTGGNGQTVFYLGPGSRFWSPSDGPNTVYIGNVGQPVSDVLYSLGLPEGRHCEYTFTFREMVQGGAPTPTPSPTPTPTPSPTPTPTVPGDVLDALIVAFQAAADALRAIKR